MTSNDSAKPQSGQEERPHSPPSRSEPLPHLIASPRSPPSAVRLPAHDSRRPKPLRPSPTSDRPGASSLASPLAPAVFPYDHGRRGDRRGACGRSGSCAKGSGRQGGEEWSAWSGEDRPNCCYLLEDVWIVRHGIRRDVDLPVGHEKVQLDRLAVRAGDLQRSG